MSTNDIAKTKTTYTYDTIGNLVYEKIKNKSVDYQYNELNQLVKRTDSQNQTYTYQYDKRGNRIAETGKKESRAFVYDETNHLVEGTNWKGDKSAYTYNALFVRINNTQTSHSGSVYSRDYVIDYTSLERDDLMIYAEGDGQLDYVQREVYAGSERIEQFTDRSNGGYERTLYVHEDVQGNTRYYTKTNGNSFAELTYDAWGMPVSPNKLLNNDHGNYVYATYTGHIFDTTLDIYFAEARFYDAQTRTWLAMDPIKDGGNWYQYCFSNPVTNWDPTGLSATAAFEVYGCASAADLMLGVNQAMAFLGNTVETVGTVVATAIAAMTAAVAAAGAAVDALPTAVVGGGVVIITVVIAGVGVYVWSGTKEESTGANSKLKQDVKEVASSSACTPDPNKKDDDKDTSTPNKPNNSNKRGVGGKGWRGDKAWRQNVDKVGEGGTIKDLNGQIPTEQEAIDLINESGGNVNRIEGPHEAPNPHNFNHINYTTSSGVKGTIQIK